MTGFKLRWLLLLSVAHCCFFVSASACVCASPDGMKNPSLVFIGTAVSKVEFETPRSAQPVVMYTFEAVDVLVGPASDPVEVETSTSDCGAIFQIGHVYRVRAKHFAGMGDWYTNSCSGNEEISKAAAKPVDSNAQTSQCSSASSGSYVNDVVVETATSTALEPRGQSRQPRHTDRSARAFGRSR